MPVAGAGDGPLIQIDGGEVAGFEDVAKAIDAIAGIEFAGGDGVAEENAREALGDDDMTAGGAKGDGGVFAGAAAAEIPAGDDDGVIGVHLAGFDEAGGVKGIGEAGEGEAAEFFVFVGDGGDEIQVLRGDDLVGVDVVLDDVNWPGKD